MSERKQEYTYAYSAGEESKFRKEVEGIRNQYIQKKEEMDQLEKLKKLDQKVKNPAKTAAIVFGIVGTLVMGTGMSLVMAFSCLIPGILIGILGIGMVAYTYPFYQIILNKRKIRYAEEILKLSSELLEHGERTRG